MTLLLTHECVVETLDFPETSIDLEVGEGSFFFTAGT